MDFGSKQTSMERVEIPQLHEHPLIPFTRFAFSQCEVCSSGYDGSPYIRQKPGVFSNISFYIYGGYRCNELGCGTAVFHKECAKPLQEIKHSSHPDHSLNLIILDLEYSTCSFCGKEFKVGYCCSICDFKLGLECVRRPEPLFLPENSYGHEHPLEVAPDIAIIGGKTCNACNKYVKMSSHYRRQQCEFFIHVDCVDFGPEAYHTSHPQHPLKSLKCGIPDHVDQADGKCLLCEKEFDRGHHQVHHCDVCNFSICRACMRNPPPVYVESPTTHEHQLHLGPRHIKFTCNACGTLGYRSPYFCLQCNFMIHRQCIDLPRVININRHDHRISYTPRLGHGEWKCKVCRRKVDGFYGAYSCSKCPDFAVHSRCATTEDVWDMVELEGTPEEEIIAPFEFVKHAPYRFSQNRSTVASNAILFSTKKCAYLPRKTRHVRSNQPFTLHTDYNVSHCSFCYQHFTGFRYESGPGVIIDTRCATISDSLAHESHPHPLYYYSTSNGKSCSRCGDESGIVFRCDECDYILDGKCALLPKKIMRHRYDDHPLFLSYGDKNVDEEYWCEACETKVDPKIGFYICNDCGVILHISCVVGDFSYIMPGSAVSCVIVYPFMETCSVTCPHEEVVSNTSTIRPLCSRCNSRCKLPSILKVPEDGVEVYFCSLKCYVY